MSVTIHLSPIYQARVGAERAVWNIIFLTHTSQFRYQIINEIGRNGNVSLLF